MIGKTLSHYKVLEKIGQGGMGEVYRAEDTNLSREVAIKVLPEQFTQDPQRLARFEREAKLLASLNHPNIAAIYGLEEADGVRFLALELVEGETLQERVAKGPVPVEETLEVCRQIAEGVEAAHEKGVIHRDLKPANVKVTPEGKVKILDFGLAKAFEEEIPVTDFSKSPTLTEEMTRAGVILGTAAYMSPEQARGKPVDKRADIFAFGAVLYELLTGRRAFEGETVTDTLAAVLKSEPDWRKLPDSTPWRIKELLDDCLQKEVGDRSHDISHARIQIKKALKEPATASPTDSTRAVQPGGQPWGMIAGLVVATAVVAGLVVWLLIQPSSPEPPLNRFVIRPSPPAILASTTANEVAISPDGRQLVYMALGEGGVQLYLRSLDDLVDRPIPGTANPLGMVFFSPDGESIGFFAEGKLKKTSLAGGSPIALCDALSGGQTGDWFEDTIVFTATLESGQGLYRVSANGGEPEMLATVNLDEGELGYVLPDFLPDGRDVLFTIGLGTRFQTALLSLETGERKVVLEDARQASYLSTGHLVYEQGATGNLMAVSFDLAALEVIGDSVPVVQGVRQTRNTVVDYAISNNGTLVYVPSQPDVQRLVWVDRKGTESVITQEDVSFSSPRISPDGKRVALAITKSGETQNIWIYNLENESLRRLTFEGGSLETWSPDGKWIILRGRDSEGLSAISRQLADGSGPIEHLTVPSTINMSPGSLTPDGGVVAFTQNGDIWMLPMDGDREPQPLISSPNIECCSKFSPDGRWIAYVSNQLGPDHVYVSPYPDPNVRWLVSEEEGGIQPVISPDGQRFLMIKAVEGSTAQINVVLNWFEELKRLVPTN
jgi:serine/threonine-protein kinase